MDEVFTRSGIAKRLGVCDETISNWVRDRSFPVRRIGPRTMRFLWSEVEAWLKRADTNSNSSTQ